MSDSQKMGDEAANKFVQICKSKGYKLKKANKKQDMYEHWDYQITRNIPLTGSCLVDVKAAKKINRSDDKPSYDWTWVEIRNVRGNDGWLKGKADYMAFEQKDHFIIVKRDELRKWCKKKIDLETKVSITEEAKYTLYTRKDRKDIISLINLNDLKKDVQYWEFK